MTGVGSASRIRRRDPFRQWVSTRNISCRRIVASTFPSRRCSSNFNFALYLGREVKEENLLEATTASCRSAACTQRARSPSETPNCPVGTSTQPLGGSLSRRVTPVVILIGVLLTIGAAVMTERLVRRRRSAETLADENERLYDEQQTLAVSLQHALLPGLASDIAGVEVATRYVAGIT